MHKLLVTMSILLEKNEQIRLKFDSGQLDLPVLFQQALF